MHSFFSQFGGDDSDTGGAGVDNTKFYEVIGVDKKASQQQIKKAYRKKAMRIHPDKHPEEKEKYQKLFQELQQAYEVLGDPDKRKLYDKYGEAGIKGSGQGMGDIFDMFFGGNHGMSSRGRPRQKKAPPIRHPIDVKLEDLYLGTEHKIKFKKFVCCKECNGQGGKGNDTCSDCNGRGVQVVIQRMGYMTVQQQRQCPTCDGEGTVISDNDKCKKCDGKGMKELQKVLNITIPRGCKHADQIPLRGQGHEIPNASNGDLIVIIRCEKHKIYKRVGADLFMTYELTLKEALCGYDIRIPHLDKSLLRIRSKKHEVTQHSDLKRVLSKGMPQKGSNGIFGHLYIKFEVKFPESGSLDKKAIEVIKSVLPEPKKKKEDVKMKEKTKKEKQKNKTKNNKNQKHKQNGNNSKTTTNNNNKDDKKEQKTPEKDDDGEEEDYEEEEEDLEIHEEAEGVEGEPTVTPYSSKSAYDEDEQENRGSSCRQM